MTFFLKFGSHGPDKELGTPVGHGSNQEKMRHV
jgi:hypothetical protein